jgi:hypothetical protein
MRIWLYGESIPNRSTGTETWRGLTYKVPKIPIDFIQRLQEAFENEKSPKKLHLDFRNDLTASRWDLKKPLTAH